MYEFKRLPELAWIAGVAAGIFLLTILAQWDPDAITDWRSWAVGITGGCVRAAAAALLAAVGKPR